jgi:hypothetical protein
MLCRKYKLPLSLAELTRLLLELERTLLEFTFDGTLEPSGSPTSPPAVSGSRPHSMALVAALAMASVISAVEN